MVRSVASEYVASGHASAALEPDAQWKPRVQFSHCRSPNLSWNLPAGQRMQLDEKVSGW